MADKTGRNRQTVGGRAPRFSRTGIVIAAVAAVLVLALLVLLLFGPSLAARPVFGDALKAAKTSDGSVLLVDPYAPGTLLPGAKEVTLSGEAGDAIVEGLLSAFGSYRYVETRGLGGTKLWPYLCIRGATVSYFYLDEDSVWVEKNSTFYRFRPGNPEGKAEYAELYRTVMTMLSEEAE